MTETPVWADQRQPLQSDTWSSSSSSKLQPEAQSARPRWRSPKATQRTRGCIIHAKAARALRRTGNQCHVQMLLPHDPNPPDGHRRQHQLPTAVSKRASVRANPDPSHNPLQLANLRLRWKLAPRASANGRIPVYAGAAARSSTSALHRGPPRVLVVQGSVEMKRVSRFQRS